MVKGFQLEGYASLSLQAVSQMVYILPDRLVTLVRPAFDLVLRRNRNLKRCVQACGCKIETGTVPSRHLTAEQALDVPSRHSAEQALSRRAEQAL